jgi:hypothetical protein
MDVELYEYTDRHPNCDADLDEHLDTDGNPNGYVYRYLYKDQYTDLDVELYGYVDGYTDVDFNLDEHLDTD